MSQIDDYIFREAFPKDIKSIISLSKMSNTLWSSEYIEMFVESGGHRTYVITDDYGYIYGFAAIKTFELASIKKLVIHPAKRRLTLGASLLAYSLHKLGLNHIEEVQCLVDERNQIGTAFFSGLGFRSKLIRGAFEGEYDGYLFQRQIPKVTGLFEMLHELRVNFTSKSNMCDVLEHQPKPR